MLLLLLDKSDVHGLRRGSGYGSVECWVDLHLVLDKSFWGELSEAKLELVDASQSEYASDRHFKTT